MKQITDNQGREGLQGQGTITSIADKENIQLNSNNTEYLPGEIKFNGVDGKEYHNRCMIYVNQYPDAKVGDPITFNAFPGDERGHIVTSALGGGTIASDAAFGFDTVPEIKDSRTKDLSQA